LGIDEGGGDVDFDADDDGDDTYQVGSITLLPNQS
jgi:hypothetical protein